MLALMGSRKMVWIRCSCLWLMAGEYHLGPAFSIAERRDPREVRRGARPSSGPHAAQLAGDVDARRTRARAGYRGLALGPGHRGQARHHGAVMKRLLAPYTCLSPRR